MFLEEDMADKKKGNGLLKKGQLVVKSKKFKKSDIVAFGICILVALVIWIYATNVELNDKKSLETLREELSTTQNA